MNFPHHIEVVDIAHSYIIESLYNDFDDGYGPHSSEVASIIRELVFETEIEIWSSKRCEEDNRYQFFKAYYNCQRAHQAYEEVPNINCSTREDIVKEGAVFFYEYFLDDNNTDYVDNIRNYILKELDNILDENHKKEMASSAIIYRACSKAIWNPRCELGKRMVMNRLKKDGLSSIIE